MGILGWLGLDGGCEQEPLELTDENFRKEVVQSDVPVVVDFWSDTCQPCRALVPTMRKLACKYAGRVKVAHLNLEVGPRIVSGLGVQATPTVLFFRNGKIVERVVGMRGQRYFEEVIETDLLDLPPEGAAAELN
jgi:thioredoxin 1